MPSIALPVSLRGQLLSGTRTFSPSSLFAAGEPGVWYEPSDLTTLFQDTAGTTPVTAPGNTVALMLDKSRGLALGAELVTNGTFSVDTAGPTVTGWTANGTAPSTASVSGGNFLVATSTGTGYGRQGQVLTLTVGATYKITATIRVVSGTSPIAFFYLGPLSGGFGAVKILNNNTTSAISYTGFFTATQATNYLVVGDDTAATNAVIEADNISVRELPGNHATQATTTARPTYSIEPVGGRRNLLLQTEAFGEAVWTKSGVSLSAGSSAASRIVTATSANGAIYQLVSVSPSAVVCNNSIEIRRITGTGTIQLKLPGNGGNSISVTSDWVKFSASGAAGGTINYFVVEIATSGDAVEIRYPQGEAGSTATNYQRVTTQHDVTEAGVASVGYLYFDGASDAMVTSTITPGIDKVQVFAGVRKLTDGSYPTIVELSANSDSINGAFLLSSSLSSGLQDYYFQSRGTSVAATFSAAIAAPATNVITALANISGDTATLRSNGVQVSQSTADQGTGNFLAYPLYIGARAGASAPWRGRRHPARGPRRAAPCGRDAAPWL